MAKTGPKRRMGVSRLKNGHIKRADYQKQEPADDVALEARIRQYMSAEKWLELRGNKAAMDAAKNQVRDQDLGTPLGRLKMMGPAEGISRKQYSAGCYFGWLVRERNALKGPPSPNVRSIDYGAVPSEGGEPPNPATYSEYDKGTPEWEADVLAKFTAMYGAVIEADRTKGKVFEVLKSAIIEEAMPDRDQIGDIRLALNAIDRARGA